MECRTTYDFEKQAQKVYTIAKFKHFQDELTAGTTYCEIMNSREGGYVTEYDIREDIMIGEHKKRMMFVVSFRRQECDVKCSCNLFEFKGLLCRHVLKVFIRNDVLLIPDKYILRRWRKDMSRCHSNLKVNYCSWCATEDDKRFQRMSHEFTKVTNIATTDDVFCNYVIGRLDTLSTELSAMRLSNEVEQSTSKIIDCEASTS
ncbi:zinc finger protein [Macleaya cordata]|uniref:Protein FAR1-RELATED SEQUENCE n=1 Tax=Macleaya cordata TaxID=56857 RepID=A0A200Q3Q3_MACCD|nr:zinc finger protein [Macleaya cordata]